jgi:hypothetical protein
MPIGALFGSRVTKSPALLGLPGDFGGGMIDESTLAAAPRHARGKGEGNR